MKNFAESNGNDGRFIMVKLMKNLSEKKYLRKKTKRSEKKIYNKIYKNNSTTEINNSYKSPSKVIKTNQYQTKIYNFFENRNLNIIPQHNNNNINYLKSINIQDLKNGQYTIYESSKRSKKNNQSNNNNPKIFNPFEKFSKILQEKKLEDKYNLLKSKGIFNDQEISQIRKILQEFKPLLKDLSIPENDRLIKIINYFFDKGFTEKIRFLIFESLINNGLPNLENFNKFFKIISEKLTKKKLIVPGKVYILLYIEYINKIIKDESYINSLSKNKFISEFLFNGEKFAYVKSNFDFINAIKINSKDIENFLQIYLNNNFDEIFSLAILKLNCKFQKSKDVLFKILSNIVSQCDKIGYLKYKKIISDNDIVFDGLKIIGKITQNNDNYVQMISIKLFGIELSEAKFRHAIQDYFLLLLSNFKN